jgi:hypothetical protein
MHNAMYARIVTTQQTFCQNTTLHPQPFVLYDNGYSCRYSCLGKFWKCETFNGLQESTHNLCFINLSCGQCCGPEMIFFGSGSGFVINFGDRSGSGMLSTRHLVPQLKHLFFFQVTIHSSRSIYNLFFK